MTLDVLVFAALDVALIVLALRRPWVGLVALLAGLPFTGFLAEVVPRVLSLSTLGTVMLAAWHDALVAGIALAAAVALARSARRRLTTVEAAMAVLVTIGAVYVAVAPVLFTALYLFRVLYEPPVLLAAVTILARTSGIPAWVPTRAAGAFVAAVVAGVIFTWAQVYLLGFGYLQQYYHDPGQRIHASFMATGVSQPRGIGFFHSPNEFGAALAIAIALLISPALLAMRPWQRTWLLGGLVLALLLTFSRSGWLAAMIAAAVVVLLSRDHIPEVRDLVARNRSPGPWLRIGTPVVVTAVLAVTIMLTSGGTKLVGATVGGSDPSAGSRPASFRAGADVFRDHPLGLGLGTAGPKSARFGEHGSQAPILTEMWYLVYAIQVGIGGALLLGAVGLLLLWRLWRDRWHPLSRAVLGFGLGLAAGAMFIPIIEEPSVFIPLWGLTGVALAAAAATGRPASTPAGSLARRET